MISSTLHKKIREDIRARLFPDSKKLFLKVFIIHLSVAALTLSVCPQLGVSTFKTEWNLMPLFMKYGRHFCDLACGVFFSGTSVLMACLILTFDEVRFIRSKNILAASFVGLISTGGLFIMSPSFFLNFSLLWLAGVMAGAFFTFEMGIYLKKVTS